MEFKATKPSRIFYATHGGAGVDRDHPCAHDTPAIQFHLMDDSPQRPHDDIGVLIPQCLAPHLFGAALAFVRATSGSDAADEFVAAMFAAYEQAAHTLDDLHDNKRTCCEAGFRTHGREHTCNPTR
ncbi:MAG: hypothetical protein HOY75_25580 [Streptomyces sp.]|nr:hypothetical protein [Streptomyces sp.]